MQRLFHKTTPGEQMVEGNPTDIVTLLAEPGFFWLDLYDETPEAIQAVGNALSLDEASLHDASEMTLLPRVDEFERYVYAVLFGLVPEAGGLATDEIDMFIGERFLVTVHRTPFNSIEWLQSPSNVASTTNLDSPARVAAFIAQLGTRRFLPIITELDARIEDLELMAMSSDPRTLPEVQALRRDVGLLRRSVGPQRDAINELAESLHPVIDVAARRSFDRVFDHYVKIIDSLDGARALLGSVLETHRGAVADQTNEIVRLLTVFSAVLLPLSVLAGVWGMNVIDLPFGHAKGGFYVIVTGMGILALGMWIYFARRGFVGRPKLSELPKSVGLGLIHIGVAPIKAVATGIEATVRTVSRTGGEHGSDDDTTPP
ncbi:MAG: magnesium transporter CorA family protein [Acidimicrobiia bacterium]